jgi:glutamyl-tRNA synthetase
LFDIADAVLPQLGLQSDDALNPVMVAFYQQVGFLPEAILNALARLGWSLDDRTENMPLDFVVQQFTLNRVVPGSASLDPDKLLAYQEYWMTRQSDDKRVAGCLEFLVRAGRVAAPPSEAARAFTGRLVRALGERLKLFSDILAYDEYFTADDALTYDEKAFEKRLRNAPGSAALLREYRGELAAAPEQPAQALEAQFHAFLAARGRSAGELIHALRVAVTGKPAGPGMFDCLELLGRDACLRRIDRALARL